MSTTYQLLLSSNPYQQIQTEIHREQQPHGISPGFSNSGFSLQKSGSLPEGMLLLGKAEDGSPVQLNLYDPTLGPLLVAGDGGSGKTAFLKSLARVSNVQDPGDIQFGVLTPFPEEWTALENLPHCLGVWPAYHPSAFDFISQMVNWSEMLPRTRQAVLFLFDGLDLITGSDFLYQCYLRWLLLNGPERHIWPVITINPARLIHLQAWLDYFHTRILGQVKFALTARSLVEDPNMDLANLHPGKQFGLFQDGKWSKFWLPPFE